MKNKIIVHLDMDAFFASVEQRDNIELQGKPVVIGSDPKNGKGRGVVSTCSYEARQYGIHSAMPISEAYRRCKKAYFVRGDMNKYKAISMEIFKLLYDFTDLVEPVSIDEAFFDITGSYHFYGTPQETCMQIKKRIKSELSLDASVGIAPIKMVAKIVSDLSKPNGLIEVKPNEVLDFLWKLPVKRLWGVGSKMQTSLKLLGITTIRNLAHTNVEILYKSFGETGLHLHNLANGIDPREIKVVNEIKSVSHEHTYEIDTADKILIYNTLSYLSQKVSRRLRKQELKGKTISIKIRTYDFKTVIRSRTVDVNTNHFELIYSLIKQMFDEFDSKEKEIRLLGVKVSNFKNFYGMDGLFVDSLIDKREKIHEAVDLIKDKFGETAIKRGG